MRSHRARRPTMTSAMNRVSGMTGLHPPGDLDTHQVERFRQNIADQSDHEYVERALGGVFFSKDSIPVIEKVESLCKRESILCQSRRFESRDCLVSDFIDTQGQIQRF